LIFIGQICAFLESVPSLKKKAHFRTAVSEIEMSPENPIFLVFWSKSRSPSGGPKTQGTDHSKERQKGQKKRRQNRRFSL